VFTKDTLDKLGESFIINTLLLDFPEQTDEDPMKIPTQLPATVIKSLAAYAETGVVPNPFLYENRVDGIPPDNLLQYLGIDDGHKIDEGPDADPINDLDEEERSLLDHYKRRDQANSEGSQDSEGYFTYSNFDNSCDHDDYRDYDYETDVYYETYDDHYDDFDDDFDDVFDDDA
jgi:hypothetical protein